jgi:xanthine dehydrogenase YagT iron-sulfur-binding subunit
MTDEREDGKSDGATPALGRRTFLTSAGAGAVGSAILGGAPAEAVDTAEIAEPMRITLAVNGRAVSILVEPRQTLLEALRDAAGLTGTKPGCERGECGACTVLVDGVARYSCLTLALEARGHEITTVEGLLDGEELSALQQSFVDEDAFQCGFCTPGQIMAAEGLLRANAHPSPDEIRHALSGNLCRCGAYAHIVNAVRRAAERRASGEEEKR